MPCNFETFRLSGLVTVDSTTSDKYLDETRKRYGTLGQNPLFDHDDQAQAVSQCMASGGHANIVGHGKTGLICTGSGFFANQDPSKQIAEGNIGGWAPTAMTRLKLVGCNTGEGTAGANLLFAIAEATGAIVQAPVGYVYIGGGCDDLFLEPGKGWQTARPGMKPAPMFDSLPAQFVLQPLKLRSRDTFVQVQIPSVRAINLHGPGPIDTSSPPLREWPTPGTEEALSRIEFNEPLLRGAPAAIETGRLELVLGADNIESKRFFRIYNDNRLQDLIYPEVLYRANIAGLRG